MYIFFEFVSKQRIKIENEIRKKIYLQKTFSLWRKNCPRKMNIFSLRFFYILI